MDKDSTSVQTSFPPPDPEPGTLYVLMHGLVCLVDVGKLGFLAYMVDVGEDHKYLIGEWLVEKEIEPSQKGEYEMLRLQLVGVTPGDAHLDSDFHAIVRMTKAPVGNEVPLRAIITLPRPKSIDYSITGKLEKTALEGNLSKFAAKPTLVSGLTIFTYEFDDFHQVGIVYEDGTSFVDCPEPSGKAGELQVSVFHIYNEPAIVLPSEHNRQEFNTSLELLNAGDIKLVNPAVTTQPDDEILEGLLFGETATLDERPALVSELIRSLRAGEIPDSGSVGSGGGGPVCGGAQGTVIQGTI